MIPRDIDYVFVGTNYLSVLVGLEILKRGERILIVDDERLSLGELYIDRMNELYYALLMKWGEKKGILSVFQKKQFFHRETVCFFTDKDKILLGRTPHENVKELLRKFPEIFGQKNHVQSVESFLKDSSSFDSIFFSYINNLTKYFLSEKARKEPSLNTLLEFAPKNFLKIYQYFLNSYDSLVKTSKGQLLLFSFRFFYQKTLNYKLNELELFYLLLSIISPSYHLKTEVFTRKIINLFQSGGGLFKKTIIKGWEFHKNNLWSMELDSYEGIILPKNLVFFGGRSVQIPFEWGGPIKDYETIKVMMNENTFLSEGPYIFSNVKNIGTSYPLLLSLPKGKKLSFYIPLFKRNGAKVDFFKEHIFNLISQEMLQHFPEKNLRLKNSHINFSKDVWPIIQKRNPLLTCHQKISLRDLKKLKNVYYYGPLNLGVLGPIRSLLFFSC